VFCRVFYRSQAEENEIDREQNKQFGSRYCLKRVRFIDAASGDSIFQPSFNIRRIYHE
jgi:hypothetical protein